MEIEYHSCWLARVVSFRHVQDVVSVVSIVLHLDHVFSARSSGWIKTAAFAITLQDNLNRFQSKETLEHLLIRCCEQSGQSESISHFIFNI